MASMEGFMSKKGKRIGSRVKRFMRLDGTTLSNHHSADAPATWEVSIKDASVTANPKRKKLIIELYNAKMELYCDTAKECEQWQEALAKARRALQEAGEAEDNKENSAGPSARPTVSGISDGADEKDKGRAINNLSKSFKVVKPAVRAIDTDSSGSEDFDDGPEAEHQPRNGPRIYEETPNSMIFKQFNFK